MIFLVLQCEAGHIVCGTCRVSHAQACGGAATYAAADASVLDAKLPCPFQEHGCASCVAYDHASDHERACPWAPCYCSDPGCGALTSPARLIEHFRADHPSWPVTDVSYGKPYKIAVPRPPQGLHVLVGQEDRCVFLVSSSALGPVTCVSVVCVRANGDAAAGVAQFKCKLWVEDARRRRRATGSRDYTRAARHGWLLRCDSLRETLPRNSNTSPA